jgi:Transposase protein
MQCLVLKFKSSKAYRHIQQEGLLPLPSFSTLRTMLSSTECKFEFNDLALQSMKEALQGRPPSHRWGTMVHDEIAIKKDISFNKGTLEHHGIVDFGDRIDAQLKNGIAESVIVPMFRPYRPHWVQPFACFASKGGRIV